MGRKATIFGNRSPPIVLDYHVVAPLIHHGLNRKNHPSHQAGALAGFAVVGNLGRLVHVPPYTMPRELPYDGKSACLDMTLDRPAHVSQAPPDHALCYRLVQRLPGRLDQGMRLRRDRSYLERPG